MLTRAILAILVLAVPQPLFADFPNSQIKSNLVIAQQNNIENFIKKGVQKYRNQQYQEALQIYQIALKLANQQQNRVLEREVSQKIGVTQSKLGNYTEALQYLQLALSLTREEGNRIAEASILNDIGGVYQLKGDFSKALDTFQQTLAIRQQVGDRLGEARTLSNIGAIYDALAKYPQAIASHQQALTIFEQQNHRQGIAAVLNNMGLVQSNLGKYNLAIELYKKSLATRKEIGDRIGEGQTLHNIGYTYSNLKQNSQAIEYYQKALTLRRTIQDRAGEATTLNNLGYLYAQINQSKQALEILQQALIVFQELGDQAGEGNTLDSLGTNYKMLGQYSLSLDFYQQALAILRKIGDRSNEGNTLSNLGDLLTKQNQAELAIVFYKQSVNVRETIRKDILGLSKDDKKSYLNTIAQTYRNLADLLLKQGRILEAQQVLELLKVEEIRAYTRNTRAVDDTNGIATNKTETKTIDKHNSLIALGLRVDECEQKRCPELRQLMQQRDIISTEYDQATKVLIKEIRDRKTNDDQFFDPRKVAKMNEIVSAQPNTILIYPLILKDKIWILWAAKGGITKSFEVPNVGLEKVSSNVLKLRTLLQSPENLAELQQTSQQLYNWLIPPELQAELKANKIEHLVFAPDSVTRYIPMGVLFDGKQYLIENYTIATIISADLTDTTARLPATQNTSILAAGLSQSVAGYSPLPHVLSEINAIVRTADDPSKGIYDGIKLLDRDFTKQSLKENLGNYAIVHIATHGKFVSGDAEQSFLVLGNGEKLPIPEIEKFRGLSKLHLVVLSACQTALGGSIGDGTEIAGISYYFLTVGAKAVIASLWEVSDDSTSLLMQQFYNNLAKSTTSAPVTKVEAIRQAQLSLLKEKITPKESIQRGNLAVVYRGGSKPSDNYSHPYYWAPFILIGNSL